MNTSAAYDFTSPNWLALIAAIDSPPEDDGDNSAPPLNLPALLKRHRISPTHFAAWAATPIGARTLRLRREFDSLCASLSLSASATRAVRTLTRLADGTDDASDKGAEIRRKAAVDLLKLAALADKRRADEPLPDNDPQPEPSPIDLVVIRELRRAADARNNAPVPLSVLHPVPPTTALGGRCSSISNEPDFGDTGLPLGDTDLQTSASGAPRAPM